MAPLIALIALFAGFFIAGLLGAAFFASWLVCLRFALAGMFLLTASAHWGKRRPDLERMVPPALGHAGLWVSITGVLELLGAVGLLIASTAPYAAGDSRCCCWRCSPPTCMRRVAAARWTESP